MNKLTAIFIGSMTLGMAACGSGGKFVGDPSTIQNQSQGIASDANLRYQWTVAINMIHNGVDLDPANSTGLIQDPRALNETPNGVIVTCEQDVPWSEIARITGNPQWVIKHPDDSIPSNTIWLNGNPVHGYAVVTDSPEKIVTACSSVGQIDGAPTGIGDSMYEMENVVLYRLGYDVSKR